MAHADQPIKDDNIHISAPHIYGAVMEALELPKDSSLTFLNAGSGTGYLTCIAASILGPRSSHYCKNMYSCGVLYIALIKSADLSLLLLLQVSRSMRMLSNIVNKQSPTGNVNAQRHKG